MVTVKWIRILDIFPKWVFETDCSNRDLFMSDFPRQAPPSIPSISSGNYSNSLPGGDGGEKKDGVRRKRKLLTRIGETAWQEILSLCFSLCSGFKQPAGNSFSSFSFYLIYLYFFAGYNGMNKIYRKNEILLLFVSILFIYSGYRHARLKMHA